MDRHAGTTGLNHVITGLVNGTSYTFTVTAIKTAGTSVASAPSAAITPQTAAILVYYIQTDHLNTPREITDMQGTTVWQWDNSDPFGNNAPNENPTGAGQFNFPLRFPGQYADTETNTYYNVNRDYDASLGRYVQSDPIGLDGGINTFIYFGGNPLGGVDPMGLIEYTCLGCHHGAPRFVPPAPPQSSTGSGSAQCPDNWTSANEKEKGKEKDEDRKKYDDRKNYCLGYCQYELDMLGRKDNFGPHRACMSRCMNAGGFEDF